jgi:hypothetical protein
VRESPRLRRLTVDTPPPDVKKFELVRLSVGVPSVGFLCSKSCRLIAPEAAMSAVVSTCSGVDDSALGGGQARTRHHRQTAGGWCGTELFHESLNTPVGEMMIDAVSTKLMSSKHFD